MKRSAVLVTAILLAWVAPASAQAVSSRGFIEGRLFVFPQEAALDRQHFIVDLLVREELTARPTDWLRLQGGVELRANNGDQVDASWQPDIRDRGIKRPVLSIRRLDATVVLDETENPFLADFYAERAGAGFQAQLFYTLSRHRQQMLVRQSDLFSQLTVCDYLFERDKTTKSTCYGACATYWPPLTTKAKPRAGRGVIAGKLGTTKRRDGRLAVTYNRHPLYTFVADTKRGDTKGQDLNQFGAGWYVLSPKGVKVERGS